MRTLLFMVVIFKTGQKEHVVNNRPIIFTAPLATSLGLTRLEETDLDLDLYSSCL